MKGVTVPQNIRDIICKRAKEGENLDDLAREFKIYPNTIRKWLAQEGVSGISTTGRKQRSVALLLAKAEREKQDYLAIIGELTVLLKQSKKK